MSEKTYLERFKNPAFLRSYDGRPLPDDTGWQRRHTEALAAPRGAEVSIVGMIRAWASYADRHLARYESGIGADAVLGTAWAEIGRAARILLNGDCGALDCGTLDGFICETLIAEDCGDGL